MHGHKQKGGHTADAHVVDGRAVRDGNRVGLAVDDDLKRTTTTSNKKPEGVILMTIIGRTH